MEIMIIVTKADLDRAVPAAREPKGTIFARLEEKIKKEVRNVAEEFLGDVAVTVVNGDPDGELSMAVKNLACCSVFLANMRNMDLVLTGSGFGVVSTNDTAPASKIRVDALDGELRAAYLRYQETLMLWLFAVDGWYRQGLVPIDSLFCFFSFLTKFAGMQQPLAKDWADAQPLIMEADAWLREKVSDELMDDLIGKMATLSLSDMEKGVVHQVRRIIGTFIRGDRHTAQEYFRRLMNTLEGSLEDFPAYAGSQTYQVNHMKPYENRRDQGAFHFVG